MAIPVAAAAVVAGEAHHPRERPAGGARVPDVSADANLMQRFERIVRADGRYPPEAFEFLHRGLELATQLKHGETTQRSGRHVTGQELAQALRVLAQRQWGLLARHVLRHWNIHRTRDFGEMVYLMIEVGLLGRQGSDDISDFDDVYSFDGTFTEYQIAFDHDHDHDDAEPDDPE